MRIDAEERDRVDRLLAVDSISLIGNGRPPDIGNLPGMWRAMYYSLQLLRPLVGPVGV